MATLEWKSPDYHGYSSARCTRILPDVATQYYHAYEQQQQHLDYGRLNTTDIRTQYQVVHVTPGSPTPLELSMYDNKMPSGLIHVTESQQTVEFLHGVVNMPS